MPRSLRARLLVVYLAGMLVSAAVVGAAFMLLADWLGRYRLQSEVVAHAEAIAQRVQFDAAGRPVGLDETRIERWLFTSLAEEVVLSVVDARGAVAYSPTGDRVPLSPDGAAFDPVLRGFVHTRNGVLMHAATAPLRHQGTTWYVQHAVSDRLALQMRQTIGRPALRQGIFITCLTFLAVFLVTTHLTLQRMLRPLRAASEEARRITPQTLDARLGAAGVPSELEPLVGAFNSALDRLQQGFRTQQEFLANAAHELKTPLALIRAQVERVPPDQRSPHLLQDVDRMARQVQQLLHLAEASEPRNYRIECLEPEPLLMEVCDFMDRVADRTQVQLQWRVQDGTGRWAADRGALFTLLKNLLENAIQHSPPGGVVTLVAGARGLVIADQGPGVAPQDLDRLFGRFWRGAGRRDEGAGLGLSICQEIAAAHGWRISAGPGAAGLEVRVHMGPGPAAGTLSG